MTPDCDERTEDAVLANLTALARQSAPVATPAQLSQGWQAVSGRMAARDTRRRLMLRWSLVTATAAAVVFTIVGISRWSGTPAPAGPTALAYRVEGGSVLDGGYLRELGRGGIRLLFTEGTQFRLQSGTRGRLRSVDSAGARIAIEQGTASFQVTPRSNARWLVDVGPFLVTVKGTAFTVAWDASSERLDIRMQRGLVSITGPLAQGEILLRAGQHLAVNLSKKELVIDEQGPDAVWRGSPAAAPAAPVVVSPLPAAPPSAPALAPSPGAAPAKDRGRHGWPDAVAAGDWDRILQQVARAGVKRTLAEASSEELFVLADAARYRRRMGLARQALLAERERFPGSPRALDAAFLLGRIEEERERGLARALAWYEEYLAQAPTGTFAAEALGRRMIATSKLTGEGAARPLAEQYLRRFPGGTYAGAAQALLRVP
jgi:hypothetical protein